MNRRPRLAPDWLNLPNTLSLLRLAMVPAILYAAWIEYQALVVALIAACFATDALDGFFARLLHQRTQLGAQLDSVADFSFYISIPLAIWWAWPMVFQREVWYLAALLASVVSPALVALIKFRTATSYHTWLVKLAALCTGLSLLALLALDLRWPFRLSVLLSVVAAVEEISISLCLTRPQSDVRSLWHLRRRDRARFDSSRPRAKP